ncbi:FAD:protein FMN transferase [Mycolicibacterium sp. 120266]|uniref:FAD:protein FMN transferase n=1 Tax=Mycolicibacterium sp. 120266 TaxID=3090601 RepID=UPI00299E2571|nr:FAD:protein FMN transferase [Mycolicibacterium sp. 120266]MDX1872500.1 FAD:protein FMN transferase [Mycolicibacterium sp. 120266]
MTVTAERVGNPGGTAAAHWRRWSMDMQIIVTDPARLAAARLVIDTELDAVEAAASRFRPDSEINALAAASGRPTPVSELLAEMLGAALQAARHTDGDVDPTIGAAVNALGYDRDITTLDSAVPLAVSFTRPATWSMVHLADRMVTLPPGVVLDLGATAKALAADRCAARVHDRTGCGVLVNLGGDIATAGTAPDGGWLVLVHDGAGEPASLVALTSGAALATSSTIRRRWRRGEQLLHHIIDPRTGACADPIWRTVTVAAGSCLAANTVSTTAVIRGRRAPNWITGQGLAARLVARDRSVHTVGGWPDNDSYGPR